MYLRVRSLRALGLAWFLTVIGALLRTSVLAATKQSTSLYLSGATLHVPSVKEAIDTAWIASSQSEAPRSWADIFQSPPMKKRRSWKRENSTILHTLSICFTNLHELQRFVLEHASRLHDADRVRGHVHSRAQAGGRQAESWCYRHGLDIFHVRRKHISMLNPHRRRRCLHPQIHWCESHRWCLPCLSAILDGLPYLTAVDQRSGAKPRVQLRYPDAHDCAFASRGKRRRRGSSLGLCQRNTVRNHTNIK